MKIDGHNRPLMNGGITSVSEEVHPKTTTIQLNSERDFYLFCFTL